MTAKRAVLPGSIYGFAACLAYGFVGKLLRD
jgi:hypothetical protein